MTNLSILFFIAISLSGCVTVPKSSSELVETSSTTQTYCYPLPPEEVGRRVESLLSKCYGTVEMMIAIGDIYVPMNADFQVINEQLPNGNRYSVRNFVGFGYSANIVGESKGCETQVQMYAVTGFWKKTFTAVDLAVKGQELKCP